MNNRLNINPLIEENMNQMIDGEFAINQINGHITIKNGDKYISKTKKLGIEIIDKEDFRDDLKAKITEDERKLRIYQQDNITIEETNVNIENILADMLTVIENYENKCIQYDSKLKELDTSLKTKIHNAQNNINSKINDNIKLLGSLMIENELMDRISGNETYFNNYVKNHWNYPDKDDVVRNYGTVNQHADNKSEMAKRVTKAEYDEFVAEIEAMYASHGASYTVSGGL